MIENFQEITQKYVDGIKTMCDPLYIVLFGSSAKGIIKSDMDVLTIVKESNQSLIDNVSDFTIDFHKKYGLKEDYDVPYPSKTVYSNSDIEYATSALSFIHKHNTFLIPPIRMSPDFLGSKAMKYRLLLNALTSNYKLLLGDCENIQDIEKKCRETIIRVIFSQNKEKSHSIEDIYNSMIISKEGYIGKGYLGYFEKNRNEITTKLSYYIHTFTEEGKIKADGNGYQATDKWMNNLFSRHDIAKKKMENIFILKEKSQTKIDFVTNINP